MIACLRFKGPLAPSARTSPVASMGTGHRQGYYQYNSSTHSYTDRNTGNNNNIDNCNDTYNNNNNCDNKSNRPSSVFERMKLKAYRDCLLMLRGSGFVLSPKPYIPQYTYKARKGFEKGQHPRANMMPHSLNKRSVVEAIPAKQAP